MKQREQGPGVEIPDHELIRPIGCGAYGEVWLARSILGEYRAVKIVRQDGTSDERPLHREFEGLREFEPLSRSHPGLVDILHAGRLENGFYYVMELADDADGLLNAGPRNSCAGDVESTNRRTPIDSAGYVPRTLRSDLRRLGRLPVRQCADIVQGLANALSFLHRHGLVHRDIKPSNIVFIHGQPKLVDIGLVAPSETTLSLVGTEGYIAPEGPGKPTADLFALGKVLYEMNTGRDRNDYPELPPTMGENNERNLRAELNEIVLKACEPDLRKRYQSAEQVTQDLSQILDGQSLRHGRAVARRSIVVISIAFVLIAIFMVWRKPLVLRAQDPDVAPPVTLTKNWFSRINDFSADLETIPTQNYRDKKTYQLILKQYETEVSSDLNLLKDFAEQRLTRINEQEAHIVRWRLHHLLALIAEKQNQPKQRGEQLLKAIEAYPSVRYADPMRVSLLQHLYNQVAFLDAAKEMDAAEEWFIDRFQKDSRFEFVYFQDWKIFYTNSGELERYIPFLRKLDRAYQQKISSNPDQRTALTPGHFLLKQEVARFGE